MFLTRKIGLSVIAAMGVAVFFLLAPAEVEVPGGYEPTFIATDASGVTDTADFSSIAQVALEDWEANEARADSAPQQQVVNGWVARDLLSVIALEADDILFVNSVIADNTEIIALSNAEVLLALTAISEQQAAVSDGLAPDARVPAMLALVLLAIAWWAITEPTPKPAGSVGAPQDSKGVRSETLDE